MTRNVSLFTSCSKKSTRLCPPVLGVARALTPWPSDWPAPSSTQNAALTSDTASSGCHGLAASPTHAVGRTWYPPRSLSRRSFPVVCPRTLSPGSHGSGAERRVAGAGPHRPASSARGGRPHASPRAQGGSGADMAADYVSPWGYCPPKRKH